MLLPLPGLRLLPQVGYLQRADFLTLELIVSHHLEQARAVELEPTMALLTSHPLWEEVLA